MNICDMPIGSRIIVDAVAIYKIKNIYMREHYIELKKISGSISWVNDWNPTIDWFGKSKFRWKPVTSYTSKQWRYK